MPIFRHPDDTQRHSIVGRTGSGKTQAALWHLSHRNFHTMPWVVYDFKGDASINSIEGSRDIDLLEVPTRPGVYIAHPLPHEEKEVQQHLWAIWQRGNTGVYVDEGYMMGNRNKAFRALLTQGRSKRIPMIVLSQRPVWMDRFVFSESEFFSIFHLQHRDDRKAVEGFVPADLEQRLPKYHSYYYDVGEDQIGKMGPVPQIDVILGTFERRLRKQKKVV